MIPTFSASTTPRTTTTLRRNPTDWMSSSRFRDDEDSDPVDLRYLERRRLRSTAISRSMSVSSFYPKLDAILSEDDQYSVREKKEEEEMNKKMAANTTTLAIKANKKNKPSPREQEQSSNDDEDEKALQKQLACLVRNEHQEFVRQQFKIMKMIQSSASSSSSTGTTSESLANSDSTTRTEANKATMQRQGRGLQGGHERQVAARTQYTSRREEAPSGVNFRPYQEQQQQQQARRTTRYEPEREPDNDVFLGLLNDPKLIRDQRQIMAQIRKEQQQQQWERAKARALIIGTSSDQDGSSNYCSNHLPQESSFALSPTEELNTCVTQAVWYHQTSSSLPDHLAMNRNQLPQQQHRARRTVSNTRRTKLSSLESNKLGATTFATPTTSSTNGTGTRRTTLSALESCKNPPSSSSLSPLTTPMKSISNNMSTKSRLACSSSQESKQASLPAASIPGAHHVRSFPRSQPSSFSSSFRSSSSAASSSSYWKPTKITSSSTGVILCPDDATRDLYRGHKIQIKGTNQTWQDISKGQATIVTCPSCQTILQVGYKAKLLYCTQCGEVSPIIQQDAHSSIQEQDYHHHYRQYPHQQEEQCSNNNNNDGDIARIVQHQEMDVAFARKMAKGHI